jgi:hypothetical protein
MSVRYIWIILFYKYENGMIKFFYWVVKFDIVIIPTDLNELLRNKKKNELIDKTFQMIYQSLYRKK